VADGGIDMTDLQGVIGLLYRADWTRLSLSADVRSESDQDLLMSRVRAVMPSWVPKGAGRRSRVYPEGGPPTWAEATGGEPGGSRSWHARLLVAPGGRYRQEYLDESSWRVVGSDGERTWLWHQQDPASPGPPIEVRHKPPLPQLFCPSELLGDFTLEVRGPVTACGRDGIAVVATPRIGIEYVPRLTASALSDHLEVIVDAELGILLRYEEAFAGQRLTLIELTAVVFDPPEVADLSGFAPPAGSQLSRDPEEDMREKFGGPREEVAKTVAGLAAGGLGAAIRLAPHWAGRENFSEGDVQAAMPPAEPAVLETDGGPPPPDDLLYLLYRSGENPAFTATRDEWQDLSAMMAQLPDSMRAMGCGGMGYLIDSLPGVTRGKPVAHKVSRLRVAGRDKYRLDYLTPSGGNHAKTIACDGEHRWSVSADRTVVGPAYRLSRDIANVVDSSWLLGCRLSGGAEVTYRGRRAYQLSVARDGDHWYTAPLPSFPADVIVDAELGCLLRLISFAGDRPTAWYELSDIDTEPVPPGEFHPDIPPGVRVVEATGNPVTDSLAVMPGATGTVIRTAADVVRRTNDAVSATRSFLDDLRDRSRSGHEPDG
jgi:outer membrane lipoprotein-sorting protein